MDLKSITVQRAMRPGAPGFFPAVEKMSFGLARDPIAAPYSKVAIMLHELPAAVPLGVHALGKVLEIRIGEPTNGSASEIVSRAVDALNAKYPGGISAGWISEVLDRVRDALNGDDAPRLLVTERTIPGRCVRVYWCPANDGAAVEVDDGGVCRRILEIRPPLPFALKFPKGIRLVGRTALQVRHGSDVLGVVEG